MVAIVIVAELIPDIFDGDYHVEFLGERNGLLNVINAAFPDFFLRAVLAMTDHQQNSVATEFLGVAKSCLEIFECLGPRFGIWVGVTDSPVSGADRTVDRESGCLDGGLGFRDIDSRSAHLDPVETSFLCGGEFFLEGFPGSHHSQLEGLFHLSFQGKAVIGKELIGTDRAGQAHHRR